MQAEHALVSWHKFWRGDALHRQDASIYPQRVLGYLALCLTLGCGLLEGHFTAVAGSFALYLLVYPHLSQFIVHWLGNRLECQSARLNLALVLGDAAHLGLAAGFMGFSLVPTLSLLCLLLFYILLRREPWHAMLALIALTCGAALSLVAGTSLSLETPVATTVLSLLLLVLQLALAACQLRVHNHKADALQHELAITQSKHASLARDLARYLSPQVWQMTFSRNGTGKPLLKTQRKKLTVFFSDIKGFTDLSEEMEPEDLAEILNGYLSDMTSIALKHGGTVDKFIGDCIMVFFGDGQSRGAKHDAMAAVSMAIEMRKHMRTLRQRWQAMGIHKRLEIRMGLNTGYCTVGTFGAESRLDYTVIGREVNLASRLESAAGPDEILVSAETYTLVKDEIMGRDKGHIQVKGFARPVSIYQVVDYRRDLGPARSYLAHEIPGFSMQLDAVNLRLEDIESVVSALNQALEQLQD